MKLKDLEHKKIAILGYGAEGKSTLRYLLQHEIHDITILDKNPVFSEFPEIQVISGEEYLSVLGDFDIIFKSPGVSPFQEKLLPHRNKFVSQTQIFFENYSGKVIGITGTKGKSTISTLTYNLLSEAGYHVKLVGNIGSPVLDEIDISSGQEYDYVVYELSSYMLQDFTPRLFIGFLNNIYPCHLDWHYDSLDIYREAKMNILRNAQYQIVNSELSRDVEILSIPGKKIYFGERGESYYIPKEGWFLGGENIYSGSLKLPGEHNKINISGVIAILSKVIDQQQKITDLLQKILPEFQGLPHRLKSIGTFEGIEFIDDAIATTPESTIAAIETYDGDLQTLFLGGQDSGFQIHELRNTILHSSIQNIVAFPDTSEKIFPEIKNRDYEKPFEIIIEGKEIQCIKTRHMKQGVDFAFRCTLPGKITLLSCAAPSFSLWKNYIEKAQEFEHFVKLYAE